MEKRYLALLMAGGILGMAMPASAQPANLLTPLSGRPAAVSYSGHGQFLAAAHDDVERSRWNAAEAALERSETLLLNNGVRSSAGMVTSPSQAMPYIIQARASVQQRNQVDALLAIDNALSVRSVAPVAAPPAVVAQTAPTPVSAGAPAPASAANSAPLVTKALLPGRWQLTGWKYHWVPPDTSYRSVQTNPFFPGHYEYRAGTWTWIAGHYANPAN